MKFPWSKNLEKRSTLGDTVANYVLQQAMIKSADAGATAGVEAASGILSRTLASAEVVGESWLQDVVTPTFLSQVGRDYVRVGSSMHVLDMDTGQLMLLPVGRWTPEGGIRPSTWSFRAQLTGPTSTVTRIVPYDGVVLVHWGTSADQSFRGMGPTSWASLTAKMSAEVERSIGDESSGPIAQIIPMPQDPGDEEDENNPLVKLAKSIAKSRGQAIFAETTAGNYDKNIAGAPRRDLVAARLGPDYPASMVQVQERAFMSVLAACGCPPPLFLDSDGTSQRESARRYHLQTVLPLSRQLEVELTKKLETSVKLQYDSYALDMVSRATVVDKLVRAGVATAVALSAVGLDE